MNLNHHYFWQDNDLHLEVYLQPRAKNNKLLGIHNGKLKIALTSPPVDNKANEHLCKFLAKHFAVPVSRVRIIRGEGSRNKSLCVHNPQNNFQEFPN